MLNGLGMAVKGVSTWDLVTPADLRFTVTMIGSVRYPGRQGSLRLPKPFEDTLITFHICK